jgi:hypothetical protein
VDRLLPQPGGFEGGALAHKGLDPTGQFAALRGALPRPPPRPPGHPPTVTELHPVKPRVGIPGALQLPLAGNAAAGGPCFPVS